jgi:cardiolipin synthase (CMP-forming)
LKNIPNLLSFARLALAPYVFLLAWHREYTRVLWMFALLGITDVIDGYLARRLHAQSRLGAYIDPLADKLLLNGMFLTLALAGSIEKWLAVVVLGRDILILVAASSLYFFAKRRNFPPSPWGKISTFVQILFVMFAVGQLNGIVGMAIVTALQWAVVLFAVITVVDYGHRTFKPKQA